LTRTCIIDQSQDHALKSFRLLLVVAFYHVVSTCMCVGLREGEPNALHDRSFANAINIAIVKTKVCALS